MLEIVSALKNLEDILETDGLDAIMVGPYDLSASLGITGDYENKIFKKTLRIIKDLCEKKYVPMGVHIVKPEKKELSLKIKQGYQFIAYAIDSVFLSESIIDLDINK